MKDLSTQHLGMVFHLGSIADWIAGAGSLAAAVVALWSVHSARRQRAEDMRNHEVKIAHELMLSLKAVVNNATVLEHHFHHNKVEMPVSASGERGDTHKLLNPIIGITTEGEVMLPPGGADLIFRVGGADLWRDTVRAIELNRTTHAVLREYVKTYEAVARYLGCDDKGDLVLKIVDDAQADKVRAYLSSIAFLILSLEKNINDTLMLCRSLDEGLTPDLEKYLGEPFPSLFA